MTIQEIKKMLLDWNDFYGQDIVDTGAIDDAKTKKDLRNVLEDHKFSLENQNIDALQDLDNFIDELGLKYS